LNHVRVSILTALLLVGTLSPAAAQEPTLTPTKTPLPREPSVAAGAQPRQELRTERNSLTLLFTGIGLAVVGLGGLGGGYAGTVAGRRECDASAADATRDLPLTAGASAYDVVYSRCVNESGGVAGGTAAMIAGGALTVMGTAFIVAGAWRITVPVTGTSAAAPKMDVGLGTLQLRWAF